MPRLDMAKHGDDARIWVFGISPALDETKRTHLLAAIDKFLDAWSAHNTPIVSGRDVLRGSFLVIAVDRRSETSGCSIDRMYGLLRQLEGDLGVAILDANRVFHLGADHAVHAMSRPEFRESGEAHTIVFDTLADRLGQIRHGAWERQASDSWHRSLLRD